MNEKAKFIDNSPVKADEVVELFNGRFTDVVNGCYYPEGTRIFLKGERILTIKKSGESDCPQAAYRVDLKGLTVVPGLFNTHCHINMVVPSILMRMKDMKLLKRYTDKQIERGLSDCLLHGVTTVRDVLSESAVRNREFSREIREGRLKGPRIFNSVHIGPVGGTFTERLSPLRRLMLKAFAIQESDGPKDGIVALRVDATEQEVRDAVDRAVDEVGTDCIKFYDQRFKSGSYKPGAAIFTQKQLNAAADQCRKRGIISTIHHLNRESFNRAVEAGVTSLAHLPYDVELTKDDIDRFIASGCFIEPTLTVGAYFVANLPGHISYNTEKMLQFEKINEQHHKRMTEEYYIEELQEIVLYGRECLKAGKTKMFGLLDLSYMFKFYGGVMTVGFDNMKALVEAGAADRFGTGSDAGASHTSIANMELEYLLMNECLGFDAPQVLKAATINSARALGQEEQLGSITEGKIADLAIIEGDPLSDSTCLGRPVKGLFKEGGLVVAADSLELR